MEGGKLSSDVMDLDELRQMRDHLNTDLKVLNQNLESLIGKGTHPIVLGRIKNESNLDLKHSICGFDTDLKRGTKRDRSHSGDNLSDDDSISNRAIQNNKLSSVLVRPNRDTTADEEQRRALLESQRNDKQIFNRNRRMFGMLMGTLKQFKTEETGRQEVTLKRSKVEEKLEMAVAVERETITKEVGKILEDRNSTEELLTKTDLKLDVVDRFKNWENTHMHLCNFIRTETKPKIFWLPKEHNSLTERKLKETKDYFGLCMAERTAKFKKEIGDLSNGLEQLSDANQLQTSKAVALEKMGRMRVFFCAFCLERNQDQVANENTFNQDIDVSHLATPHISSNISLTDRSSSNPTPVIENSNEDNPVSCAPYRQSTVVSGRAVLHQVPREPSDRTGDSSNLDIVAPILPQHQDNNRSLQSSSPSPTPPNRHDAQLPQESQHQQNRSNVDNVPQAHQVPPFEPPAQSVSGSTAKLSYDIISVREPLAKILAERQQFQLAQQHQRQLLGDHDYIEVYGERGSSCFYEEIAGSTTSSATYDQIGAVSNHNYQVLVHAYGSASQSNEPNNDVVDAIINYERPHNIDNNQDDTYDIAHLSHHVNPINTTDMRPSTSAMQSFQDPTNLPIGLPTQMPSDRCNIYSTQSVPVYSVINKATKRRNVILRVTDCHPPIPPPKNLLMTHRPSTSAISKSHHSFMLIGNTSTPSGTRSPPQSQSLSSSTSSSYLKNNVNSEENTDQQNNRLPQPPPRLSKKSPKFTATNRPLPLPDTYDTGDIKINEDLESLNNGYELLKPNFDDDHMDVGYERIREPNRYSGGSLSSQLCHLQVLDNGGYESVQPIYSSPSNVLTEPNYEAIGPPTASDIAVNPTARLTAAVTVIEQLLKKTD